MTSTPIKEVSPFFMGNVGNTNKGQELQNTESFSKVFDKTQSPVNDSQKENNVKKSEDTDSIQNHAKIQKNKTSESFKEQTEDVKEGMDVQDMEEAAVNAAGMMLEEVAKIFEVTVEEVEVVLDELGLTSLDLLNGENLTKVVLALNPDTDALAVMTNETLFADLKNLMNMAQDLKSQLAQQFHISQEDVTNFINTVKEQQYVPESVVIPQEMTNSEEPQIVQVALENPPETIAVDVEMEIPKETVEEPKATTFEPKTNALTKSDEGLQGTVIPKTNVSEYVRKDASDNSNQFQQSGQGFQQQFVNQLTDAIENATGTSSSYGVNGQEILRQITDYIKVHVNSETTEMELQLHPATLGNIKVQLVSTGGVLSAIFTTENEAVKAALESQLIQLKENFTEQGLKVESVEVNVSAQGFERSLDQQEQQGQNQFENQGSRRGNRRIRLDGGSDQEGSLTQELPEDDRIVADMMIRNGNSVDYTV